MALEHIQPHRLDEVMADVDEECPYSEFDDVHKHGLTLPDSLAALAQRQPHKHINYRSIG